MNTTNLSLRLFLDEGVPDSVGRAFQDAGHEVLLLRNAIAPGSPDPLVCAAAEVNAAVLVALDSDMKQLASRRGVGGQRFKRLSLIKLSCRETRAADRVRDAMSLIEHEWAYGASAASRRIFIEIGNASIRTNR